MMPRLMMSDAEISKIIRDKKKKMAQSEPDFINTSPVPDMNAQDVHDMKQRGRIESTLDSPKKISSDEAMMAETYDGVGLSPEQMGRMARLRKLIASLSLSQK